MSRVRFMSPYLKGGRDTAKLSNRARYIATRPGVEVLRGEQQDQPATKKQQAYIQRLLRDFPGAEELLEYEDYRNTPTQANADTFIRQVQEDFAEPMSRMENYLDYVSRPGVQMDGEHGLWCARGQGAQSLPGRPGGGGAHRQRVDASGGYPAGGRGAAGLQRRGELEAAGVCLRAGDRQGGTGSRWNTCAGTPPSTARRTAFTSTW